MSNCFFCLKILIAANVCVYDGLGIGSFVKCEAWQSWPVQIVHRDKTK